MSFDGSIGTHSANLRVRNSLHDFPIVPNTYNGKEEAHTQSNSPRARTMSLIGRGTQVMACLRGAQGSSLNYKMMKPTLAEIQEKIESSAKKVAKK